MQASPENSQNVSNKSAWPTVIIIILFVIAVGGYFYLSKSHDTLPEPAVAVEPLLTVEPIEEVTIEPSEEELTDLPIEDITPIVEEVIEAPVVEKPVLPQLNESDDWIKEKLTSLTWRKELLKLVIDDDMIRRLVVFTDNFSQGIIAYEHTPLIKPASKFTVSTIANNNEQWQWDENSSKRFTLYVEFLRSFDVESLVDWYFDLKPLIDEAYGEMGYPDDDFTETLQEAITRVLDMDIPKEDMVLVRPSVMYKYQSESLESLSDTEKLLLRLGKDNLLVIKSVLLEFSDKLGRRRGE